MNAPTANELRNKALDAAAEFMRLATDPAWQAKDAFYWSLAAKNDAAVGLACEQLEATEAKAVRERSRGR